jgi:hypothetical protein
MSAKGNRPAFLDVDVDFDMPSAEGRPGYPQDLLDLSESELRELVATNGGAAPANQNGEHAPDDSGG